MLQTARPVRSAVRHSRNQKTTFRELDLFPSSGEGETPNLLGPLEGANLKHSTTQKVFFLVFRTPYDEQIPQTLQF
jgi:hypothetical protein